MPRATIKSLSIPKSAKNEACFEFQINKGPPAVKASHKTIIILLPSIHNSQVVKTGA